MFINYRLVMRVLGMLICINGLFMLLCMPFSIYYKEGDLLSLLYSFLISLGFGGLLYIPNRNHHGREGRDVRKREGFLIVTLCWVALSLFGALPYLFSGAIPSFTDAVFETASGYSTTGASVLTDIESVHKGILTWRSLTQWIGGMGIIVLAVAILPFLGIGGMQLFVAEASGISADKLQPRIKETAKRLWMVYVLLTCVETILLSFGGMTFYDAVNHSLTTVASGGFSTKNASMAHYDSAYLQYVVIVFMFLAGVSFNLNYFIVKRQWNRAWQNDEFRAYTYIVLGVTLLCSVVIWAVQDYANPEKAFRDALFQVVSVITTTGFVSADYTAWAPALTVVFFLLMFTGGSAGSTAGGVKIVRHLILLRNSVLNLKRQLHPTAVIPVRFNGKAVSQDITFTVLAFFMTYMVIFAIGSLLLASLGVDFLTAIGAVATSLGNIGPGLGTVGPVDNFAHIPAAGKWLLSFLMIVGRLELFTVLVLFTPYFWRHN